MFLPAIHKSVNQAIQPRVVGPLFTKRGDRGQRYNLDN